MCYQWWAHRRTAQLFVVRLEEGAVTGACGPLSVYHMVGEAPYSLLFDPCSMATFHARQCPEEFVMAEPFLRGHPVPVRAEARRGIIQDIMDRPQPAATVQCR